MSNALVPVAASGYAEHTPLGQACAGASQAADAAQAQAEQQGACFAARGLPHSALPSPHDAAAPAADTRLPAGGCPCSRRRCRRKARRPRVLWPSSNACP
jgi:hypothetical protein